jgi:hypothetical protein
MTNHKKISEFIKSTLNQLDKTLDEESINSVNHYLDHNEYEMAFEGLFIEIMQLQSIPQIDLIKAREIAEDLNLNNESVFDFSFWNKFELFTLKHANINNTLG